MSSSTRNTARITKDALAKENQGLNRRVGIGKAMGEIAKRVAKGENLDPILNEVARECAQTLGLDLFCVMIPSTDQSHLMVRASVGLDPGLVRPIPLEGESVLKQLAEKGPTLFSDKGRLGDMYGGRAFCIPLIFRDVPLGLLCVAPKADRDPFDDEELEGLNYLAAAIALATFLEEPVYRMMHMERSERELQFAHALKAEMLPPPPSAMGPFTVTARTMRCLEVGGDFHDLIALPDDRYVMVLGETSGRGARAALNLAHLKPLIASLVASGRDLGSILQALNEEIITHGQRGQMVNLTLMEIRPLAKQARLVRAGGTFVFSVSPQGAVETLSAGSGTPLGVLSPISVNETEVPMGDHSLLLVTDGINKLPPSEAGETPLEYLRGSFASGWPVEEQVSAAQWAAVRLIRATGGASLEDDLTLISIDPARG